MKKDMYIIWFSNKEYLPQKVEVNAMNQEQAVILAKAERIKQGLDYTIHMIIKNIK